MQPILVATDGSEYSRGACERAIDEAAGRGVSLHVLCVIDSRVHGEPGLSTAELGTIEAEDRGFEFVEDVAADARDRGVSVETDLRHGIPEDRILGYADDIDAGLIVLGERGDHTQHVGGVRRTIAAESDREVLVAPSTI